MSEPFNESREGGAVRGLRLLRPYGGWLAVVLGLVGLLALADMVQPYFLKLLIDDVFVPATGGGGNWSLLWIILPGMVFVYVARNALFYTSRMRSLRVSEDLCFDLRKRLFEHLQQLSLRFYKSHQPGQVSARLMDDTFRIQVFIHEKLPMLLRYLIEFQVLLIIIYVVNWRLALVCSVVLPLHYWTYRHFRAPIRRSHTEAQAHLAAAHGTVVEKLLAMEVVKSFSAEDRESSTFHEAIDATRRSKIRSQRYQFTQKVVADLIVGLGTVLLLGYGAWEVRSARMTGGEFLMFFWYVKMLYPAVLEVISGAGHLTRAGASADRVFEMLDEPAEPDVAGDVLPAEEIAGRLECRDACFAYEDDGPPVLQGVNLTVEPGEHVAITGPSGSGKSTLINLMPRFNEVTGGEIRIDGRPAGDLPIRTLRGAFGIVFQEVFLFNASVSENLRYARPDATMEEMAEACRRTGADEFIERLPDGYLTRIGGPGVELSRGEKQRITLARALLKRPRILILDEATASIDAPAAREIVGSILEVMKDRTVIMVTHDDDLLELADRVIALDRGSVVYDGSPGGYVPAERHSGPSPAGEASPRRGRLVETKLPERRERPPRPPSSGASPAVLLGLAVVSLVSMVGCVQQERSQSSLQFEDPKISEGIFLHAESQDELRKLADALDSMDVDPDGIRDAAPTDPIAPPATDFMEPPAVPASTGVPSDAVHLFALPKLNETEIREVLEGIALRLVARGYVEPDPDFARRLPPLPDGVTEGGMLVRRDDDGTRLVRLGHRTFLSQPPQLWAFGMTWPVVGPSAANPDLAAVESDVTELLAGLQQMRAALAARDLEAKLIQLSYIDAPSALELLKGLGVTGIDKPSAMPPDIDFEQLPYVVLVPDPEASEIGLIGEGSIGRGEFGVSTFPNLAGALSPNAVASPMTQLLVLFHPAHPEQFSRVRRLVDDFIDRPARQIFVEGMVLEISEEGLKDLGIEWELDQAGVFWKFGSPEAGSGTDTLKIEMDDLDLWRVFTRDFPWIFEVKIRALIEDGKAEILSRPSVLTLSNRQSTIRVGLDIPIATSQEGALGTSNKIAFDFKYLPTGIMLNIRPRINEAGDEVSMLVDTIVSARVPGADLEIRSTTGTILASAPTVASRRVSTYARIRNNTPFIIGGLVSREESIEKSKVPLLGDLPLIGAAFRAEKVKREKREVIIVLTPYVLPEGQAIGQSVPKDDERFDSIGNDLFRDSYRLRSADVFDLAFLTENQRIRAYRELAREAIEKNFRLGEQEPFRSFATKTIPGGDILVTRMLYEVLGNLEADKNLDPKRLIYLESQSAGGFDVRFLDRTLGQVAGGVYGDSFFDDVADKALAISFSFDRNDLRAGRLLSEPIPKLFLVDCPDRATWSQLLLEMNGPAEDGRQRFTILIHQRKDLDRLRRAIALKETIGLNGGRDRLLLQNFGEGQVLMLPSFEREQVHVIDAEIARLFFHTEHYYRATIDAIERRLRELDEALRQPLVRGLLNEREIPARAEPASPAIATVPADAAGREE